MLLNLNCRRLSTKTYSQEDAGPVSGLLGIMMELFNVFPNLLATIGDIVGNIARGSNDEDDEEEDDEEGSTDGLFAEEADEENEEEMVREKYKYWAKENHQSYPSQNPFSPFGVQQKPYTWRALKARVNCH